jgi:iron complex transport system substrate-binding protein
MKRIISMLLVIVFFILSCKKSENTNSFYGKIVIDSFGKEISIPHNVDRVIPIFNSQSEYMCILGAKNKIIGVGIVHSNDFIFDRIFPDIYKLPVVGANTINLEKIVQLKPDVVLCGNNKNMIKNIERLNIIAVGTFPENINGILEQLRITGIIVDKEPEAEKIIKFLNERLIYIKNITQSIPEEDRPKIYYARYNPYETLGKGVYSEIINVAGGKNVVSDAGANGQPVIVSLENIYKWNPDIIILRDKAPLSADDLYKDPKWKNISAIINKRIYREHRNWSEYRIEAFFGIMEKAKWFHPNLFTELNPDDEYDKFFKLLESFKN